MKQASGRSNECSRVSRSALEEVARQAGGLLLDFQEGARVVIDKGSDGDFATEADLASQKLVGELLRKLAPNIPFVGEESEPPNPLPSEYLVCDPLDGTLVYSCGLPEFGVILAHVVDFQPVVAVMYLPKFGEMWSAEVGRGIFLNGQPFTVPTENARPRVVGTDLGYVAKPEYFASFFEPLLTKAVFIRSIGSAVGGVREVLSKNTVAYVCYAAKVWDVAAPLLLVREAGGYVRSVSGEEPCLDTLSQPLIFSHSAEYLEVILSLSRGAFAND